jgi:hypothetical protein
MYMRRTDSEYFPREVGIDSGSPVFRYQAPRKVGLSRYILVGRPVRVETPHLIAIDLGRRTLSIHCMEVVFVSLLIGFIQLQSWTFILPTV